MRILRQRQVKILGWTFPEPQVGAGPGYAHNLKLPALVIVEPQVLADGALVGPILPRQHLVHNGHAR